MRSSRGRLAVPFAATLLACAAEGISGTPQPSSAPANSPAALWQLPSQQCALHERKGCAQMNSYVLRTQNQRLIVIDGGSLHDAAYLKAFIEARSNTYPHRPRVHAWFVSHPHVDHVGALTYILRHRAVQIDQIYGSILPVDTVAKYGQGRVGQEETKTLEAFLAALSAVNTRVTEVDTGQVIQIDNVRIEILGKKNPELTGHGNLVNNSSVVMRVSDGSKSILFPGDLGVEGGQKLLNTRFASLLPSDYVQMAHHGQNGVDREFCERVHPKYCLWPTSRPIWELPATQRTFDWMRQPGIGGHFFQFEGLVGIDTIGDSHPKT